jgi:hypothetical protein
MGPPDKIAAAAFFISLSALVTNVALMWLKWPRIVVEVAVRRDGVLPAAASTHAPIHSAGAAFLLTVINNGSKPVTVTSVGLTQRAAFNLLSRNVLRYVRRRRASRVNLAGGRRGAIGVDGHRRGPVHRAGGASSWRAISIATMS